jgi:hypothetical protein
MSITQIPKEIIERVRQLEERVESTPQEIASAVCATRFSESWMDNYLFTREQDPSLMQEVYDAGLNLHDDKQISVRDTNLVWLHFFAPIATYRKPSTLSKILTNCFALDPGIKVGNINRELTPYMSNSFWFSVGGNMLQDSIIGEENQDELRWNILGLLSLDGYQGKKLSDLIEEGNTDYHKVEGEKFRTTAYYQLAQRSINPHFSHLALRYLASHCSSVCNRLVPIQSPELIR